MKRVIKDIEGDEIVVTVDRTTITIDFPAGDGPPERMLDMAGLLALRHALDAAAVKLRRERKPASADHVYERRLAGATWEELQVETGYSPAYLRKLLKKANKPRPPRTQMLNRSKLDDEAISKLVEGRAAGKSFARVAAENNVSIATVFRHAKHVTKVA